ncbi:MAG: ribonuclease P protein component [Saprospiraceae bacterium]|nr:ribonuclease P protein component [Saprospiraceae bacterium]
MENQGSFTFSKAERLKSRKTIAALFRSGNSFVAYPLRVVWSVSELGEPGFATVVISVPKRNFKTAVQRNRLKRQIREAYRLNKHLFYEHLSSQGKHVSMMISYIAKEPESYDKMLEGIHKLIRKFPYEELK